VAAVRAQLDPEAFAVAWAEGRALSPDEAIALTQQPAPPAPAPVLRPC